jgi:hypothetical protein
LLVSFTGKAITGLARKVLVLKLNAPSIERASSPWDRGCCRTPSGSVKRMLDELTDAKKALKRGFYTRIIARLPGF